MADHDLLCPQCDQTERSIVMFDTPCRCEEYARVRSNERESLLGNTYVDRTHAEAVAARLVEIICEQDDALRWCTDAHESVLAKLDALRSEVAALHKQEWATPLRAQIAADIEAQHGGTMCYRVHPIDGTPLVVCSHERDARIARGDA